MNSEDIIEFEEKHPELQLKFLEEKGLEEAPINIQIRNLTSQEYWDFVLEEFNNYNAK